MRIMLLPGSLSEGLDSITLTLKRQGRHDRLPIIQYGLQLHGVRFFQLPRLSRCGSLFATRVQVINLDQWHECACGQEAGRGPMYFLSEKVQWRSYLRSI